MKIVVIGGSGLIGKKLVTSLHERGHEAVAASPSTGVNAVTGAGLADVLVDAEAVVDVTNSPSFEDAAVLEFFEKSSRNLLAAEADAGVGHHVAVSIVGADRIPDSGYMRAKVAQEKLIQSAGTPYTILRATQFFEFIGRIIAQFPTDGRTVRAPFGRAGMWLLRDGPPATDRGCLDCGLEPHELAAVVAFVQILLELDDRARRMSRPEAHEGAADDDRDERIEPRRAVCAGVE